MATKKNQSVEIEYTAEEIDNIKTLESKIEDADGLISTNTAEIEKYEKYIGNLSVDVKNLSNVNFKLFENLAKANSENVDMKIALFDKEQQASDDNPDDVIAIELAKKNEKESAQKSQEFQNAIKNNEKEIEVLEKKIKIAKDTVNKLQFAIKKAEAQKMEYAQYIDEIKNAAIKRKTAKK